MLQKEFFQVQPFNPNPYWDPVIINLSGAQKFEEDTVFKPGRYRIELAPGTTSSLIATSQTRVSNMDYTEEITVPFIIRAYCGSNGADGSIGTNPYSGVFKVNGITTTSSANGVDVNHIFGAGGGNGQSYGAYSLNVINSGGGNCLGDGCISMGFGIVPVYGGAGSCLHLLPVGGVFGTDYIRAYHASSNGGIPGGAYGGGGGGTGTNYGGGYASRGGNSPYGNGGTPIVVSSGVPNTPCTQGTGIGAGGKTIYGSLGGGEPGFIPVGAGAYFNGTTWLDVPGNLTNTGSSYIRITFLGAL